jgi:hypothetical protein
MYENLSALGLITFSGFALGVIVAPEVLSPEEQTRWAILSCGICTAVAFAFVGLLSIGLPQ